MAVNESTHWNSAEGLDEANTVPPPTALSELATRAGVRFNGDRPWDIQTYDDDLYQRILSKGSLGFGEAYMDGLWDSHSLDELFTRLLRADVDTQLGGWARLRLLGAFLRHRLFNLQSHKRAFHVAEQHYDIGNDVFQAMLDPTMSYSCAYWQGTDDLATAQQQKLEMICRKLELRPGERLLEIGCGWGGLARYASEHYGVEVLGVTVSKEQQQLARQRCAGLPVTIELLDYRRLTGQFDKVVSVGMFEHVGPKNYRTYFDAAQRLMKDDGLFLLHTIGSYKTVPGVDPWIDRYIFPNGKLPSAEELSATLNDRLLIED